MVTSTRTTSPTSAPRASSETLWRWRRNAFHGNRRSALEPGIALVGPRRRREPARDRRRGRILRPTSPAVRRSEVVRPRRPGRHTRRAGSQGAAHPVPARATGALRALAEAPGQPRGWGVSHHAGDGDAGVPRDMTTGMPPVSPERETDTGDRSIRYPSRGVTRGTAGLHRPARPAATSRHLRARSRCRRMHPDRAPRECDGAWRDRLWRRRQSP